MKYTYIDWTQEIIVERICPTNKLQTYMLGTIYKSGSNHKFHFTNSAEPWFSYEDLWNLTETVRCCDLYGMKNSV